MAYVQAHSDPGGALPKWTALVAAERKTLEHHPQETSNQIVMELLRRKSTCSIGWAAATRRNVMRQMVLCERGDSASLDRTGRLVRANARPGT